MKLEAGAFYTQMIETPSQELCQVFFKGWRLVSLMQQQHFTIQLTRNVEPFKSNETLLISHNFSKNNTNLIRCK